MIKKIIILMILSVSLFAINRNICVDLTKVLQKHNAKSKYNMIDAHSRFVIFLAITPIIDKYCIKDDSKKIPDEQRKSIKKLYKRTDNYLKDIYKQYEFNLGGKKQN